MSFWVGPRRTNVNRPPPPGRSAPGSGKPDKQFPNQKSHSGTDPELQDDSSDGSGLYPTGRRGRRGTVQGAPRAPMKRAPKAPPPKRRFSRFTNTPPQNVETRPMSASEVRRAPPPITKEMKKEVQRKSGFLVLDSVDDDEDLPEGTPKSSKKQKSSMFRTNTDTVWTDEDLGALHGEMKEEFERLMSLSKSESQDVARKLDSTGSMSISRGPMNALRGNTLDSNATIEYDEVSETPLVVGVRRDSLGTPLPPTTTPKNVGGLLQEDDDGMLKAQTSDSMNNIVSTDSDMTVYNSVELFKSEPSSGGAEIEKKRSARDGLENPPLTQQETKDPTSRGRRKSKGTQVTTTQVSL